MVNILDTQVERKSQFCYCESRIW